MTKAEQIADLEAEILGLSEEMAERFAALHARRATLLEEMKELLVPGLDLVSKVGELAVTSLSRPTAESLAAGSGSEKYSQPGTTDWLDRGKPDYAPVSTAEAPPPPVSSGAGDLDEDPVVSSPAASTG